MREIWRKNSLFHPRTLPPYLNVLGRAIMSGDDCVVEEILPLYYISFPSFLPTKVMCFSYNFPVDLYLTTAVCTNLLSLAWLCPE